MEKHSTELPAIIVQGTENWESPSGSRLAIRKKIHAIDAVIPASILINLTSIM
jgi:hypothetical protein